MAFEQTYLATPEEMPLRFCEAWNTRNALALANLFAEEAEFVNVVGLWWHHRAAIWKAHDYGLRVIFPDSLLEVRQVRHRLLSDTTALVHARMKLSGQSALPGHPAPQTRQNIFSFVLQKLPLGWVAVSAHNTDIVPGQETNLAIEEGQLKAVDYRKK
ncbi:MAG: SgcJ/EcaC family oxidoreductase [Microscillaceae bacterium]